MLGVVENLETLSLWGLVMPGVEMGGLNVIAAIVGALSYRNRTRHPKIDTPRQLAASYPWFRGGGREK
jgi:hypothetical protein